MIERRIRPILRRQGRLEDEAAREVLRLLRATRRSVLGEFARATAFGRFRLSALLEEIDRAIAATRGEAETTAARSTRLSWDLGRDLADVPLGQRARGIEGLSQELLQAAIKVTTTQLTDVWNELGAKLKGVIRRTTLGVDDPFKAMQVLSKSISDPKTFGRTETRAEVIVRTEVNRTFSLSTQTRLGQAADAGVTVKKYWLTAGDRRVRPSHVQAGKDYGPANAIPHDKPFIVGGEKLMFPLDPRGSAEETIACRCVSVPQVSG